MLILILAKVKSEAISRNFIPTKFSLDTFFNLIQIGKKLFEKSFVAIPNLSKSCFFILTLLAKVIYRYDLHDNPNLFPNFLAFPIFLMTYSSFSSLTCHQKYRNGKKSLGTSLCKCISSLYFLKTYDRKNQNEKCEFKEYFDLKKAI